MDGHFTDIQGFKKAVHVFAKYGRMELESRLVEFKDKHDARAGALESGTKATPELRDGRMRRPYRGNDASSAWLYLLPGLFTIAIVFNSNAQGIAMAVALLSKRDP